MPTYAYECDACGDYFQVWEPIHASSQTKCKKCGGRIVRVIETVRTYGVGERGAQTRSADLREAQIDRDRPAYRALRDEGHQPPYFTGAADLAARATNDWEIKTGGRVSVPDDRRIEINEMLADAAAVPDSVIIEEAHRLKEKVG